VKNRETKGLKDQGTKGPGRDTACSQILPLSRFWSLGLLVLWSFGPLVPWSLGLLVLSSFGPLVSLHADDWAPNLTVAATWESNVTNANVSSDQIDSIRLNGNLVAAQRYALTRDDALQVALRLGGEWWPRYNGLSSGLLGARGGWRHQFGADPLAPVVMIEGFADAVAAKDTGRRGAGAGAAVSVRKRLNDLTRATFSHEVGWFDARYGVYDRGASETSLELERDLSPLMRVTLTGRFRDGDVVSYAEGTRPDLIALAPQRIETDIFGRTLTAHRIDARTWGARAAFVRALDDDSAIVLAYEWRGTRRQALSFSNSLVSISLVHQF